MKLAAPTRDSNQLLLLLLPPSDSLKLFPLAKQSIYRSNYTHSVFLSDLHTSATISFGFMLDVLNMEIFTAHRLIRHRKAVIKIHFHKYRTIASLFNRADVDFPIVVEKKRKAREKDQKKFD
jgi:hypothetical protein